MGGCVVRFWMEIDKIGKMMKGLRMIEMRIMMMMMKLGMKVVDIMIEIMIQEQKKMMMIGYGRIKYQMISQSSQNSQSSYILERKKGFQMKRVRIQRNYKMNLLKILWLGYMGLMDQELKMNKVQMRMIGIVKMWNYSKVVLVYKVIGNSLIFD